MLRILISLLFFSAFLFTGYSADAQKQLIILKKEKVLLRLYPGDEFVFTLKGSKKIRRSYINNLSDTAVVAHHDVIPYHQLDKIYFSRKNLLNVVGGLLVVGGVGYFLIDQINVALVQGEGFDVDEGVLVSSAVMVGVGLPMLLSKKKYARVGGKFRVRTADKGSVFYRPDSRRELDE